jgi:hypothetical protein
MADRTAPDRPHASPAEFAFVTADRMILGGDLSYVLDARR